MKAWLNKYILEGFFGWSNFKWVCRELMKVGSNEPSFFSKKRMESGMAFFVLQYGMLEVLSYLIASPTLSMTDFGVWAGIELLICGYTMNKIEAAKAFIKPKEETKPEGEENK